MVAACLLLSTSVSVGISVAGGHCQLVRRAASARGRAMAEAGCPPETVCRVPGGARAPSTFCAEDTWAGGVGVGRRRASARRGGRCVLAQGGRRAASRTACVIVRDDERTSGANRSRKGGRSRTPTSPTLALLPFSAPKEVGIGSATGGPRDSVERVWPRPSHLRSHAHAHSEFESAATRRQLTAPLHRASRFSRLGQCFQVCPSLRSKTYSF